LVYVATSSTVIIYRGCSRGGEEGHASPFKCSGPPNAMFVLVTSLCLAFSDADIDFDFVLTH